KQNVPAYSAVKIRGERLYKLARMGVDIVIPQRTVMIHDISLLAIDKNYIDLRVSCSKGTYIRALCDDIGKALGVGAHVVTLERTRIGKFRAADAAKIEEVGTKKEAYFSIDEALSHLEEVVLDDTSCNKVKNGLLIVRERNSLKDQYVRLKTPENVMFGIGKMEGYTLKTEKLILTD
ncbi:MAG: pseudouridine synthase, partial [Nitrospirota bacterium]